MRKMYLRVTYRVIVRADDDVTLEDAANALSLEASCDDDRADIEDVQRINVELEDSK